MNDTAKRKGKKMATRESILARIDSLQNWFAAKPYGWRETATAGQLQQWADRERELNALIARLEA